MKNIKSKLTGWAAVAVAALLLPSVGRAQGNDNIYLNIDWQYNVPSEPASPINRAAGE